MAPNDIHRIGLDEVKRIRDEMQIIIDEVEFEGDFKAFLTFLRTDPQFYYDNPDDLYKAYLAASKRIDPELVKLFGKLPRIPYGVKPIPAATAPDTTTAYYTRPAADGSRAGIYWVNLYKPEVRPKYEIEVLSVHEAMPGHHLQLALQQELGDMPNFRRFFRLYPRSSKAGVCTRKASVTILACTRDPYSAFGDTDLRNVARREARCRHRHSLQRLDARAGNRVLQRQRCKNRTRHRQRDRSLYSVTPAKRSAYKIGQLKILALRANAGGRAR